MNIFLRGKLIAFLMCISLTAFGQIEYEKGYFVSNNGSKTDCFIRNKDWNNNPRGFKYKLSEKGEVKDGDLNDIKEFRVLGYSRYLRAEVDLDMSQSAMNQLSIVKFPQFERRLVFLKVLVEGKAVLYYYKGQGVERFFYQYKDSVIHSLINKQYLKQNNEIALNDSFRIQILKNVCCGNDSINDYLSLEYNKRCLQVYFQKLNLCVDPFYKSVGETYNRELINIRFSTGLESSSISTIHPGAEYKDADFGNKISYRLGLEFEYILPFNKNRWSMLLETNYQSYKSDKKTDASYLSVDYKSVSLSFGVRRYWFLNSKSRLFLNGIMNSLRSYDFNSKIGYRSNFAYDNSVIYNKLSTQLGWAIGIGGEYKKIYTELRYYGRQTLPTETIASGRYQRFSYVVGVKIFSNKTRK